MMHALARLSGLLSRGRRRGGRKNAAGRRRMQELFPTLEVRVLEERRVFHAGAIVAPVIGTTPQQPPPPAPPAAVTLDASQNLLVRDTAAGGQNDQLSIRFDAASGVYAISDPSRVLTSDVAGSSGSGSHTVFVPVAAVAGDSVIVATGQGDDAVSVDLSGGLGGKSLVVDGGVDQDSLTLMGGNFSTIDYRIDSDGTQIDAMAGLSLLEIDLIGVEPVWDQLSAENRQFWLGDGINTVSFDGQDALTSGTLQLSTGVGSSVTFASASSGLSLTGEGQTSIDVTGSLNLGTSDLTIRAGSIEVSGTIIAVESRIDLEAESSLTVTASGVFKNGGGQVFLNAGSSGTLKFFGRIDVSATDAGQTGGEVRLLGQQVEMLGSSAIEASGHSGGGVVLVGGDYQGLNAAVPRATHTLVSAQSSIRANALNYGDGGKIIVWADQSAIVAGSGNLQARGGSQGGDGGLIETSGKRYLYIDAAPDASAPNGAGGTWLLDPYNVTIVDGGTGTLSGGTFTSDAATTTIDANVIEAALATQNVTINTGAGGMDAGNIVVSESIDVTTIGTRTLTLNAHNNIEILAAIDCNAGNLNVGLNANLAATGGDVLINAAITTSGGNFTSNGQDFANTTGTINTGGGNVNLNHTGAVTIARNISLGSGDATIAGSTIGFGNATLSANDVALTATGAITGGTATSDISVSGGGASISLSGSAIGADANLMELSAGAGAVSMTATSGGMFAQFAGNVSTSQLTLSAGGMGQTIRLASSTGVVTINDVSGFDANTEDDNFVIETGGAGLDIDFTGATLVGNSVRLAATGDIETTTGNAIANTSGVGGTIALIGSNLGSSSDPLIVEPGSGDLELTASGNIFVRSSSGDLSTSQIAILSASANAATISLGAAAGGVIFDDVTQFNANTANDRFTFTSGGGDITLSLGTALTAARATLIATVGDIVQTVAGTQLDTSTANGLIHLEGQQIGSSSQAVVIDPGAGDVEVIATTGDVFLTFEGSFSTGQLDTLSVAATAGQIVLASATGSITVNSTGGFNGNTADDHFTLLAPAGGVAFSGGTLTGASVTIDVQTTITRSGGAANDINTSADDGAISLVADGGIGSSLARLRVNAGDGIVEATTQTGSIWLSAPGIELGEIQTGLGQQTVSIATTGDLNVVASSTTDDNWQLSVGDDLSLVGTVAIQAATFSSIQVTGDLVSGDAAADFIQAGLLGTIVINAGSMGTFANPIMVDAAPTATFDLRTNTGDLNFALLNGDLTGARFVGNKVSVPANGADIFLTTLNGSINLGIPSFLSNAPASADLRLEARGAIGDIVIAGSPLVFAEVTLIADGSITSLLLGTSIDTSAANGDITLRSAGPIGISPALPLVIEAGGGEVSATTTGALGDISLQSTGNLLLGQIDAENTLVPQTISIVSTGGSMQIGDVWSTEDIILLTAQGNISFLPAGRIIAASVTLTSIGGDIVGSNSASADIDTSALDGPIVLSGQGIGTAATALAINPGDGMVSVSASGDVFLDVTAGDFAFTGFSAVNLSGAGQTFDLSVLNGSLTIDTSFASLTNDNLVLSASGDIDFSAAGALTAASFDLQSNGAIHGGGSPADMTAVGGAIVLDADDGIGSGTTPLAVAMGPAGFVRATTDGGDVFLASPGLMRLDAVSTGNGSQVVDLQVNGNLEIVADSSTDDAWTVDTTAAGNLIFAAGSTIEAASFTGTISGVINSDGTTVAVDTSDSSGAISLDAAAIGDSTHRLTLLLAAGDLSLAASAGDIWIDIAAGFAGSTRLVSLQADQPGAMVNLKTEDSSWLLPDAGSFQVATADVTLTARGTEADISFVGSTGPLRAAAVTLDADGFLRSSASSGVDVDTSLVNGAISLTAGADIGTQANPLSVQAGTGDVTPVSQTGNIFVASPGRLEIKNAVAQAPGRQLWFTTTGALSPLLVDVVNLGDEGDQWHLRSSGGIGLLTTGASDIRLSQLVEVNATSPNQSVQIVASAGGIVIDSIAPGFVTSDDRLTLRAGTEDITGSAGQFLAAAELELLAESGAIGAMGAPIHLANTQLTSRSAETQWYRTNGAVRISRAETTLNAEGIELIAGTFFLAAVLPAPSVVTDSGTLTVGSNAILRGNGMADSALVVVNGGRVDLGFSDTGTGILQVTGDATFAPGAELIFDINPPYMTAGANYDQIIVDGNLFLNNSILFLDGGQQQSMTSDPIVLFNLGDTSVRSGFFNANMGSLFVENGVQKVEFGLIEAGLLYDAGIGSNDIIISQLSFTPPVLPGGPQPQPPRIPIFTRTDPPPPVVAAPPQLAASIIAPLVEPEVIPVGLRYIEIRIVAPIDEAGNVREEFAMKLPAEWLADLPAVLRRLPDDHYRIYLMLEGGNEERLVMDVFVRDGRPVEPADTTGEFADALPDIPLQGENVGAADSQLPMPSSPPQLRPAEGDPVPRATPENLPNREPVLRSPSRASSRMLIGGTAAVAAMVAARSRTNRFADDMEEAAQAIAQTRQLPGWRLWRFASQSARQQ